MLALKRILYESATCCNVKSTVIYFIRTAFGKGGNGF